MTEVKKYGFEKLLGYQGADTKTCKIVSYKNGTAVGEQTLTIVSEGGETSYRLDYVSGGGFDYTRNRDQVLAHLDANPDLVSCPTAFFPPSTGTDSYTVQGELTSQETQSSGIYEILALVAASAIVSVITVLILKGTAATKKVIEAQTEETNQDENIYYYTGPNGKEYWGIKKKFRR